MLTTLAMMAVILSFAAAIQLSIATALHADGEGPGQGRLESAAILTCVLYGAVVAVILGWQLVSAIGRTIGSG